MSSTQKKMLRYVTIEVENWLYACFPLQPYRAEAYRTSCFFSTKVELMTSTQKKMLRYDTIEVENTLVFHLRISSREANLLLFKLKRID
jgi:hypothetical protein